MGARDVLRHYFLDHLGEVLDTQTLSEVAGIRAYARRIRELRTEEGYDILTHRDLDSLKPGEYVLYDPKPKPRIARSISASLRAEILRRNGFSCQVCGRAGGDPHPTNPGHRVTLNIDHIQPVSEGGSNDKTNLRVLCSACNEARSNLETPPSEQSLNVLAVVRRAPRDVQLQVYEALKRRFASSEEQQSLLDTDA